MQLSTTTLALLAAYEVPALLLGSLFFGETVIVPAAFLAGEGVLSFSSVFLITFGGTLASDLLWFILGPSLFAYAHRFARIASKSEAVLAKLQWLYADRPLRALLASKFVFGTRILAVIYLSSRKLSLARFLAMNLVSTLLWLAAVVAVGWLAGRSVVNLIPFLADAPYALLALLALIVGIRFTPRWFWKTRIEKKASETERTGGDVDKKEGTC